MKRPNQKRFVIAAAMYLAFFLIPVSSPVDLVWELVRVGTAATAAVVMCAVMLRGSWGERIGALLLSIAPLWWVVRTLHSAASGGMIPANR